MRIIEHKKKKGLCVAIRCTRQASKKDVFCHRCRKRYQKENNPVVYTFNMLKNNAKRRGKAFDLTIEQFREFCEETNYIALKGRHKKAATIDRIDHTKGYSIDNIQILSLQENGKKGQQEGQGQYDDDVPF